MRIYLTSLLLALALLLPGTASAGWGDENWGEMVWGQWIAGVPSMSMEGLIALAIVIVLVPAAVLARHRRRGAP